MCKLQSDQKVTAIYCLSQHQHSDVDGMLSKNNKINFKIRFGLDLVVFLNNLHSDIHFIQDLHCHLTTGEVVGYLGGHWDRESHSKHKVVFI